MDKDQVIYLNGKFTEKSKAVVSVFDHGLLYGDGVFEGIREYAGSVFRLTEHIDRLYDSAKSLHLKIPMSKQEMADAVVETIKRNRLRDSYIRLVVSRGVGDLGVDPNLCKDPTIFIIAEQMPSGLGPKDPKVVRAIVSSVRRDSVDATSHEIKSLNYLNSILAKIEANNAGVDDAILLDSRGFVSEASVTNVFVVKGGVLSTPSAAAGILRGITRGRLIQLAQELGLEVHETDVTRFELVTADEVFLAGTKSEIRAVGMIDGAKIGSGGVGPMTRRLYHEFGRLVLRPEEGSPVFERSLSV